MTELIDAILFDMGGTLHYRVRCTPAEKLGFVSQILELINSDVPPVEFAEVLSARAMAYQHWAQDNLIELNENDLWTQWMLPDFPAEQVGGLALKLNALWRETTGRHIIFPETQETVLTLYRRGYRLGLVSNTTSSIEAPRALDEWKLSGCFEVVILSCVVGKRKPDPQILLEAANRMGVNPVNCAYIGDRPDRDVLAARLAGFSQTVIVREAQKPAPPPIDPTLFPDHFIENPKGLLAIFPGPRSKKSTDRSDPRYDASLSTMWGMRKFAEFSDFLIASRRLGFASVELNHQVTPAMLASVDLKEWRVSSVHEPCPAVTSADALKKRDMLISSPDEDRRHAGVDSIKRSIDLAHELGVPAVVVHCGQVQSDWTFEDELRSLFDQVMGNSPAYRQVKTRFMQQRAALVGPYISALKKSLQELLTYASPKNVRLGLENRYHYYDIPALNEMSELLSMTGLNGLGFIFDVGHAYAMDRLGFFPFERWLQLFSTRIIGVHLHDVVGIHDHRPPGTGEVDFRMLASYLPANAFRTFEIQNTATPEQLAHSLEFLVQAGCINRTN